MEKFVESTTPFFFFLLQRRENMLMHLFLENNLRKNKGPTIIVGENWHSYLYLRGQQGCLVQDAKHQRF